MLVNNVIVKCYPFLIITVENGCV